MKILQPRAIDGIKYPSYNNRGYLSPLFWRGGDKMKNVKRRFPSFAFYDRAGIEADLEKQAEKGWLLEKIGW